MGHESLMFSIKHLQLFVWAVRFFKKLNKKRAVRRVYIEELDTLPIYVPPYKASYVIVHHSATKDGKTVNTRAIKKYHIRVKGWSNIGYHFLCERVGDTYHIEVGRPMNEPGAHCRDGGFNFKSIGVCMIGNFDLAEPPKDQLKLTYKLIQNIQNVLNIQNKNVIGHREAQALAGTLADRRTHCPGLKNDMVAFRRELSKTGGEHAK